MLDGFAGVRGRPRPEIEVNPSVPRSQIQDRCICCCQDEQRSLMSRHGLAQNAPVGTSGDWNAFGSRLFDRLQQNGALLLGRDLRRHLNGDV